MVQGFNKPFTKLGCDDAKRILGDVASEKCFWVNSGPILRNIYELENTLASMDSSKFLHHANRDKNDFANWAADVLQDSTLAKRIRKAKVPQDAAEVVAKRIKELERIIC